MKNSPTKFLILYMLLLLCISCSKNGTNAIAQDTEENTSLEVRLMRTPGVFVQNNSVRIRGIQNSFNSDSEPLFIINGQALNGGYEEANQMISPAEIKSIRVLKNPGDLALYGVRGLNGVIIIKLLKENGSNS